MYSPQISEDLIPLIYRRAKEKKKPMTRIVDEILRESLTGEEQDSNDTTDQHKEGK
jgi:hypothetical protein